MVDGDDLVAGLDELRVDGAHDGVPHDRRPRGAADRHRRLVDGLKLGALADLEHKRPVWALLWAGAADLAAVALCTARSGIMIEKLAASRTGPGVTCADCVAVRQLTEQDWPYLGNNVSRLCTGVVWCQQQPRVQSSQTACISVSIARVVSFRDWSLGQIRGASRWKAQRPGSHQAQRGQLHVFSGAVLWCVVAEHSGTVEGAVVLGVVQPALRVVRAVTPDAEPNDVRRATQASNTVLSVGDQGLRIEACPYNVL